MNKLRAATILTGLLSVAMGGAGQAPPPQPEQPKLTEVELMALRTPSEQLEQINQDFRKEHPGWHLQWTMNIVKDEPVKAPPPAKIEPKK